jgi:isopentenyldiphosphate isomerase
MIVFRTVLRERNVRVEQFDVLDCAGHKTGEVILRDEAHRTGAWHGAFHCLIIFERGGRGYALFQKRAMTKKIAPGKFDVSAGGHYASGEDASIAGPREIREELGLTVQFSELYPLGKRVFVHCFSPGIMEYEFQDVFLLQRLVRPESLSLQHEEVDGVLAMDVEQGTALFSGRVRSLEGVLYATGLSAMRVPLSAGDFVPSLDNYYLKLLLLAQRYLRGERELLVI